MRIRLTPLNILSSVLLIASVYLLVVKEIASWQVTNSIQLILLAVICFFSDIFFRKAFVTLKRIWIVESVFVIFTAALIIILQHI